MSEDNDKNKSIHNEHFRLLRTFGRNREMDSYTKRDKKKIWTTMCEMARLPVVEHEEVVEAWRTFVSGNSARSSLVADGDIDAEFTTVGVYRDKRIVASSTMKTKFLLMKLLKIYVRSFKTKEEFLEMMSAMCHHQAVKQFGPKSPS